MPSHRQPASAAGAGAAARGTAERLAASVRGGDRRALAKAITLVESTRADHQDAAQRLLELLLPHTGRATRIGVSGVPGVGKSTFIEAFGLHLIGAGKRVAVLAVDPSSAVSGGSILGDKTRMARLAAAPDAFIRPSPAAGSLGGVARRTREALLVCGAAGYDVVLVETVGVGQSESEVADVVDALVFVTQPGAGDLLQFMKAGVLEIPDVFVVNKADLGPIAERTARELEAGLGLAEREGGGAPRVVLASARDGRGIGPLLDALDAHHGALAAGGALAERRRRGRDRFVAEALRARYGSYGLAAFGGAAALAERLAAEPDASGFGFAERLGREIEEALRK